MNFTSMPIQTVAGHGKFPLLALPNVQFLLMSATLGDISDIAHSLEQRTGRTVDLHHRCTPTGATYLSICRHVT